MIPRPKSAAVRAAVGCVLVAGLLGACAQTDMDNLSHIRATNDGFVFQTFADTAYQDNDPGAESHRLASLERFALTNGLCPNGWTITDRQAIKKPATIIGVDTRRDVYYTARCQ